MILIHKCFTYTKRNGTAIMNILIVIGGKLWARRLWIWLLGSWYYNLCITFWFITVPRRFRRGNVFKYPKCTIWLRLWGNKSSTIYQHKVIEKEISAINPSNVLHFSPIFSGVWGNIRRSQKFYWIITFEAKKKKVISQRMFRPSLVG